jgi:hypothetical protein
MKKALASSAVVLLALFAIGCSKAKSDQDAIRESIQRHLAERGNLNLAAMDVNVKEVNLQGDHATAQVEFRLKQGGAGMEMGYELQRHGGTWVVVKGQPAGGEISHPPLDQTHGSVTSNATGPGAPTDDALFQFPQMPSSGASQLPAGHPSVGEESAPKKGARGTPSKAQ